jgi:hypothetical protein
MVDRTVDTFRVTEDAIDRMIQVGGDHGVFVLCGEPERRAARAMLEAAINAKHLPKCPYPNGQCICPCEVVPCGNPNCPALKPHDCLEPSTEATFDAATVERAIKTRKQSHDHVMQDPGHANFCKREPCGDAALLYEIERLRAIEKRLKEALSFDSHKRAENALVRIMLEKILNG